MIEELLLPNWPSAREGHIDLSRRAAFDRFHDFGQTAPTIVAAERGVDQVHMIGHNNGGMQIKLASVFSDAAFENNVASRGREYPATVRRERDEQGVIVFLIVLIVR